MDLAFILAVIACAIGGALGGFALARPQDALTMVGLKTDPEKAHSLSEARATYGGLFLLAHGGVAAALGYAPSVGATMALTLALAWTGAAIGRGWSMMKDGSDTPFNVRATIFEFLMGVTLALPFWTLIDAADGAVLV
ncbi:MAG TPA: DUF4345 family protein [Caulobacteraceae bacterium]|nr:DUF4345 family protein [Caulobacteraceae bacterium]